MGAAGMAWERDPLVGKVANALLDRCDAGPTERSRAVRVPLGERVARGLFQDSATDADYQWSLLQQMAAVGWIRLVTDKGRPGEPGYYRNPRAELLDEPALRRLTGRDVPDALAAWREQFLAALARELGVGHPALALLSRRSLGLESKAAEDVAQRLCAVRGLDPAVLLLREVSSQLFWGHSKVLDQQEDVVAALCGTEDCPFAPYPIQLNVYLPEAFSWVLFVENWATVVRLARQRQLGMEHAALVYASGYRGSARRLRSRAGASLFFASASLPERAEADRFATWLQSPGEPMGISVEFFGDLDYEGMAILKALRQSFPAASAWRPGYEKLLQVLEMGHPAELANKQAQRDPGSTGCAYADQILLPTMRSVGRFVDQESAV